MEQQSYDDIPELEECPVEEVYEKKQSLAEEILIENAVAEFIAEQNIIEKTIVKDITEETPVVNAEKIGALHMSLSKPKIPTLSDMFDGGDVVLNTRTSVKEDMLRGIEGNAIQRFEKISKTIAEITRIEEYKRMKDDVFEKKGAKDHADKILAKNMKFSEVEKRFQADPENVHIHGGNMYGTFKDFQSLVSEMKDLDNLTKKRHYVTGRIIFFVDSGKLYDDDIKKAFAIISGGGSIYEFLQAYPLTHQIRYIYDYLAYFFYNKHSEDFMKLSQESIQNINEKGLSLSYAYIYGNDKDAYFLETIKMSEYNHPAMIEDVWPMMGARVLFSIKDGVATVPVCASTELYSLIGNPLSSLITTIRYVRNSRVETFTGRSTHLASDFKEMEVKTFLALEFLISQFPNLKNLELEETIEIDIKEEMQKYNISMSPCPVDDPKSQSWGSSLKEFLSSNVSPKEDVSTGNRKIKLSYFIGCVQHMYKYPSGSANNHWFCNFYPETFGVKTRDASFLEFTN